MHGSSQLIFFFITFLAGLAVEIGGYENRPLSILLFVVCALLLLWWLCLNSRWLEKKCRSVAQRVNVKIGGVTIPMILMTGGASIFFIGLVWHLFARPVGQPAPWPQHSSYIDQIPSLACKILKPEEVKDLPMAQYREKCIEEHLMLVQGWDEVLDREWEGLKVAWANKAQTDDAEEARHTAGFDQSETFKYIRDYLIVYPEYGLTFAPFPPETPYTDLPVDEVDKKIVNQKDQQAYRLSHRKYLEAKGIVGQLRDNLGNQKMDARHQAESFAWRQ